MYIELENITKRFGLFAAIEDISVGIQEGKLTALLGPSGSGKTTILRVLAGLETQDEGSIYIDGECVDGIPAGKRNIGFVFQNYALFRYMTVYENVAFGLKVKKRPKAEIKKTVMDMIELVGLSGTEKRYPNQLSGGQRQRFAFARALASYPKILLLDEPFAAIDAKVRAELRGWLKEMIGRVGITSIFVTHDQDEAIEVADEIIVTNSGHVDQVGTPQDIYLHPETPFVAKFIGENISVENADLLKAFSVPQGTDEVLVRPEAVYVGSEPVHPNDPVFSGEVTDVSFRGDSIQLKLRYGNQELISFLHDTACEVSAGDAVDFSVSNVFACKDGSVEVLSA